MKTFIVLLACCFAAFSTTSIAQTEFSCATVPPQGEVINPTETRGIYLPAQGDLKILVVFARFKDDTTPHNEWPAGSDPPSGKYGNNVMIYSSGVHVSTLRRCFHSIRC
jgi:hypothetical protein